MPDDHDSSLDRHDSARWRAGFDPVPEHIAGYKILELLGEGGMGTVFLAEQKEPIRRRVALKVIKLGQEEPIQRDLASGPGRSQREPRRRLQGGA